MVAILPILSEPTTAIEPGDGAFHDPALGFDDTAFGMIGAFDDFNRQATHGFGCAILKDRSGVGTVSEQLAQERELPKQCRKQQNTAVAILNIGGSYQRVQHEAQCVDQNVTLLALDQLAGIEAMRVDARPPFSALFTLGLSITQAVGLASRSACSRHLT